ncbi:replication initiation negative regulator SeqA [Neiella marina]|uniref:Negative modulator of initiation of replication n=1 Tax=Neiella holothuriorum TaxID=2870530 RepID=A0ABS7EEC2_9GAMM|nr:replication initiation negative regulator SeqA [Neiella holothuriorum]MBW8190675.1 replication initiation negative regulator SeqA [Neiella holothuriorum]
MKTIEVDDDLYQYIAGQTQQIGESASDILRRLLMPSTSPQVTPDVAESVTPVATEPKPAMVDLANLDLDLLAEQKGVVGRFLLILAHLHQEAPEAFAGVTSIRGRDRLYFAASKNELLAAGSSTNPKAIEGSPYWVVTNNNTDKKKAILNEVCQVLGLDAARQTQLIESL